jgi:hypothetical protein
MGGTTVVAPHRLLNGITAYWKLDETSGLTCYDSYGDNDLTVTNGATINTASKSGFNKCVSFDSSTEYVGVGGRNQYIVLGSGGFTVSMWIYFDVIPSVSAHVSRLFSIVLTMGTLHMWVTTSDKLYMQIPNMTTGTATATGNTSILASAWYHVICTIAEGSIKLYLNGNDDTSGIPTFVGPVAPGLSSGAIYLSSPNANVQMVGLIDEVACWNRTLSASEVTELYNSGTGLVYPFS